jgi:hypothetical protein
MMPIQLIDVYKTQIAFLNEVRRLESGTRTLILYKVACKASQFAVHSRNQFGQSLLVTAGPCTEKLCRLCWRRFSHSFPLKNYKVTGGPIPSTPGPAKLFPIR